MGTYEIYWLVGYAQIAHWLEMLFVIMTTHLSQIDLAFMSSGLDSISVFHLGTWSHGGQSPIQRS